MREGLDLEIATLLVGVELARQRALNVPGPCIMPLDEVAVVGVHDPHETGKACRRARMQGMSQLGRRRREFGYDVGNGLRDLTFEASGLNALDALDSRGTVGRFGGMHKSLYINENHSRL
jgi:hypothetical protein